MTTRHRAPVKGILASRHRVPVKGIPATLSYLSSKLGVKECNDVAIHNAFHDMTLWIASCLAMTITRHREKRSDVAIRFANYAQTSKSWIAFALHLAALAA